MVDSTQGGQNMVTVETEVQLVRNWMCNLTPKKTAALPAHLQARKSLIIILVPCCCAWPSLVEILPFSREILLHGFRVLMRMPGL